MKIASNNDYRQAKERVSDLRSAGATVESNAELAQLEAAIANYEVVGGGPGESKGRG